MSPSQTNLPCWPTVYLGTTGPTLLVSVHTFGPLTIGPVAGASALGEAQVVAQHGLLSDVARRRDRRLGRPDLIHFGRDHRSRTSARRVCRDADLELHRCSLALYPRSVCLGHHCLMGLCSQPELATEELTSTGTFPRL